MGDLDNGSVRCDPKGKESTSPRGSSSDGAAGATDDGSTRGGLRATSSRSVRVVEPAFM